MFRSAALSVFLFGIGSIVHAAGNALDLSDRAIAERFNERRQFVLKTAVNAIVPGDATKGSKFDVAACLQSGQQVPAALARLAQLDGPAPSGNMFWVFPTVAVMMAGKDRLDEPARARIAELWRTYWPSRGDTENHWVLSYASLYLVAQTY